MGKHIWLEEEVVVVDYRPVTAEKRLHRMGHFCARPLCGMISFDARYGWWTLPCDDVTSLTFSHPSVRGWLRYRDRCHTGQWSCINLFCFYYFSWISSIPGIPDFYVSFFIAQRRNGSRLKLKPCMKQPLSQRQGCRDLRN